MAILELPSFLNLQIQRLLAALDPRRIILHHDCRRVPQERCPKDVFKFFRGERDFLFKGILRHIQKPRRVCLNPSALLAKPEEPAELHSSSPIPLRSVARLPNYGFSKTSVQTRRAPSRDTRRGNGTTSRGNLNRHFRVCRL